MNLTSEQLAAVKQGEHVRVVTEDVAVVVLRADVYERLQALVPDDTHYSTGEEVDAIMAEDDANDPYLAEFQKLHGGKHE